MGEYYHCTNLDTIKKIFDSGNDEILSVDALNSKNPEEEVNIEAPILPIKVKVSPELAHSILSLTKDPDKIFLTEGGYHPAYGDAVLKKNLGSSIKPITQFNSIPNERYSKRALKIRKNDAIYVPDEEVAYMNKMYGDRAKFYPKSLIKDKEFTVSDSISAIPENWSGALLSKFGEEVKKTPADLQKAVRKEFGRKAVLGGSTGLGINLPGSSDKDVFIVLKDRNSFDKAINKFRESHTEFKESPYNEGRLARKVFSNDEAEVPTDVAFMWGPNAEAYRDSYLEAASKLTDRKRQNIIREKQRLKDAWILPEYRYKKFKRETDKKLGIRYFG